MIEIMLIAGTLVDKKILDMQTSLIQPKTAILSVTLGHYLIAVDNLICLVLEEWHLDHSSH